MEGFRKMTLTKKENKEVTPFLIPKIEKQVEKLHYAFFDSVWDIVDDMYFIDMKKQEIIKILTRDLKYAINTEYKILRTNHPNHNPCPICEDRLKQ